MKPACGIVTPNWGDRRKLRQKDIAEFRESIKGLGFFARLKARIRFWLRGSPDYRIWLQKNKD